MLGRLRTDTPELDRFQCLFNIAVQFYVRIVLARLLQRHLPRWLLEFLVRHYMPASEAVVVSSLTINGDPGVSVFLETFLRRRGKSELQRGEDDILVDILFPRKRIDHHQ